MKNPTPHQIALYSALILTAGVFALLFLTQLISAHFLVVELVVVTALVFPLSYFLIKYMLNVFIYRKIKLVYKNIHERKRSSKRLKRPLTMQDNILEEVEQEVMEWADDKTKEIEELKEMEQYRREFIGNVSHELKTPIFNVQGYLHTLIDGGIHDDNINIDYLYKAANNLDRLNNIVEDLEAISLLESGNLEMEMQKFDIHELTNEVFETLEMQADSNDIRLGFKKGCDRPTFVVADRERIRQVLTNLVNNSIKYGRENGKTQVGFYDMDENILIEVADNGIGIDKEHLTRLFERFYRIDKSRSRHHGGTGLGLAIVKHIIEAHNQTINVRSTPGVGSTFGFTLKKP